MSEPRSDALVFFGATGDLAYWKIFPALQAMVKRTSRYPLSAWPRTVGPLISFGPEHGTVWRNTGELIQRLTDYGFSSNWDQIRIQQDPPRPGTNPRVRPQAVAGPGSDAD
jgi:hypothetical protein